MKNHHLIFFFLLFSGLFWSSCNKDNNNDGDLSGTGDLSIELENRAGSDDLKYGKYYTTANGDSVTFTTFDYYVSNFILEEEDGSRYVVPKDSCYFLCKQDDPDSRFITLRNIPAGDYHKVYFLIGVDSLKSLSDISERSGVLDPTAAAAGMYWSWNSGYIFVKVEGTSPQAPLNTMTGERTIQYHTGLFGGTPANPTLNNLKTVELHSHDEPAKVRRGKEGPEFHVFVDVLEMFTSPVTINVAQNPTSHAGLFSESIANNYADMFQLDHVHNHE